MYTYDATIIEVHDGDTFTFVIDLGFSITIKSKLRLYGINTPEVIGASKVKGIEARDYVRNLLLNKTVLIKVYKTDKYGRYVADVFPFENNGNILKGQTLTQHLISKNYGVEFMKDI